MSIVRFLRDRRGGVAPLLALSIVPIVGAVATSVDYARVNKVRSAMQSALDSTGLMLAKKAKDMDPGLRDQAASNYFKAVFNQSEAQNVTVTTDLTQPSEGSYKVAVNGTATVETLFGGIFGKSTVDLSASSEVLWGIKKLNLALALDNTGSMATDGKMTALKEAAHNLLNTLESASKTPGDIMVSIVPFAVDVNVGTDKATANWIDWSDWEKTNGTCSRDRYKTQSDCTANGSVWTTAARSSWNGCVNDRDQHNDVLNTATAAGTPSTMYRAHQASACPASLMPLSTTWTSLHSKIDAMTPAGNTNVTIGLQAAWQTLSAVAPFNAPADRTDLDKVIILLTDGDNTQNRWSSSSTAIDARTEKACTNAKAANVRIYTVRVINGNATLLRNCATSPSMYYDVQQASQLNATFEAIAQNLANLRIVK